MPAVEPLALDFGLGRFSEIGEIEFWVANEEAAGYCGKFLFVDDHQTCPYHRHDLKHETFFVMKGAVRMVIDGEEKVLREGDTWSCRPDSVTPSRAWVRRCCWRSRCRAAGTTTSLRIGASGTMGSFEGVGS